MIRRLGICQAFEIEDGFFEFVPNISGPQILRQHTSRYAFVIFRARSEEFVTS